MPNTWFFNRKRVDVEEGKKLMVAKWQLCREKDSQPHEKDLGIFQQSIMGPSWNVARAFRNLSPLSLAVYTRNTSNIEKLLQNPNNINFEETVMSTYGDFHLDMLSFSIYMRSLSSKSVSDLLEFQSRGKIFIQLLRAGYSPLRYVDAMPTALQLINKLRKFFAGAPRLSHDGQVYANAEKLHVACQPYLKDYARVGKLLYTMLFYVFNAIKQDDFKKTSYHTRFPNYLLILMPTFRLLGWIKANHYDKMRLFLKSAVYSQNMTMLERVEDVLRIFSPFFRQNWFLVSFPREVQQQFFSDCTRCIPDDMMSLVYNYVGGFDALHKAMPVDLDAIISQAALEDDGGNKLLDYRLSQGHRYVDVVAEFGSHLPDDLEKYMKEKEDLYEQPLIGNM